MTHKTYSFEINTAVFIEMSNQAAVINLVHPAVYVVHSHLIRLHHAVAGPGHAAL